MFKGTMTKKPVQKLAQGTTQNSYNIMTQQTFRKHIFLCFSDFSVFVFFLLIIRNRNLRGMSNYVDWNKQVNMFYAT